MAQSCSWGSQKVKKLKYGYFTIEEKWISNSMSPHLVLIFKKYFQIDFLEPSTVLIMINFTLVTFISFIS